MNPWKARTPEEAWAILAMGFDQALGLPSPLSRNWARYPFLTGLLRMLPLPGVGDDLISIFEGGGRDADLRRVEKINRLLERRKIKLVILVDDMERAEPEVIRRMFPVLDRLSELKNCFFVFAIDRDRVGRAFRGEDQGEDEAIGYLDKVFDLQLELPEPLTEDIAEMCEKTLDRVLCPKLAACFEGLRPLLPTNPRAANKFLSLAEKKETLFLRRYRDDEHPYLPFFTLWMMEAEFPGSVGSLLQPEIEHLFDSLTRFNLLDWAEGKIEDKKLDPLREAFIGGRSLPNKWRLSFLFDEFVKQVSKANGMAWRSRKGFRLRWAASEHLRLLEMSVDERGRLEECWIEKAGCEPFVQMLAQSNPDKSFSDPKICASQLITIEAQAISGAISACYGNTNDEFIEENFSMALSAIKRLRRHLEYATLNDLEVDLFAFDEELFRVWVEDISRMPLEPFRVGSTGQLRSERFDFSIELIRRLPVNRCFLLYTSGADRIVGRFPQEWEETRTFLKNLRLSLLQRVMDHVISLFREGLIPAQWEENGVMKENRIDFFYDPSNWLPVEFPSIGVGTLRDLVDESRRSEAVANCFAELVEELFTEPLSKSLESKRTHERGNILELIGKDQVDYIQLLWLGGQSPLVEEKMRRNLLRQRDLAIEHGRDEHKPPEGSPARSYFISASQIEELFPLDDSFPALEVVDS